MRVLIAVPVLLMACLTDPPYHPYSAQQHAQQGGPAAQGPYQDPNSPSGYSNHPTYQTNLNGPPPGPRPPPYVPPANGQGGVAVGPSAPGAPPQPQPMGGPTGVGPATGAPPPINASPTVAGRYQCWVAGAGMYAQSNLGLITLDFNNSYSSTQNTSTGTYRVDGTRVLFTGGPLAGYVGALESNSNGPLVRFHAELPSDPGSQLRVGDHVCYLTR
ncbi:MAG TPA: hypothetical protein VF403_21380 [Kofleriaceae bacterium]